MFPVPTVTGESFGTLVRSWEPLDHRSRSQLLAVFQKHGPSPPSSRARFAALASKTGKDVWQIETWYVLFRSARCFQIIQKTIRDRFFNQRKRDSRPMGLAPTDFSMEELDGWQAYLNLLAGKTRITMLDQYVDVLYYGCDILCPGRHLLRALGKQCFYEFDDLIGDRCVPSAAAPVTVFATSLTNLCCAGFVRGAP